MRTLFVREFEEAFEEQVSKRGGYRLSLMANKAGELLAFVMYKTKSEQKCLTIAHIAVPVLKRRMGYGKMMVRGVSGLVDWCVEGFVGNGSRTLTMVELSLTL